MSDDLACWTCGTTAVPDTRFPNLGYVRCPACDLVFAPSSSQERLRELYGEAYFEDYGLEGTYDDGRRPASSRGAGPRALGARGRAADRAAPGDRVRVRLVPRRGARGRLRGRRASSPRRRWRPRPASGRAPRSTPRCSRTRRWTPGASTSPWPGTCSSTSPGRATRWPAVRTALRPGGCLLLELPNIASLRATRQGEDWYGMEPAHHVAHYSPEALDALLRASGYEPEVVESVHPGTLLGGREAFGPRGLAFGAKETLTARAWIARTAPLEVRPAARRRARPVEVRPSVVVPSWNGLEVLRECLPALLMRQTVDVRGRRRRQRLGRRDRGGASPPQWPGRRARPGRRRTSASAAR